MSAPQDATFTLKCVGCGKIETRPAEECTEQPFCNECYMPMIDERIGACPQCKGKRGYLVTSIDESKVLRVAEDESGSTSANVVGADLLERVRLEARLEEAYWWRHEIDPDWVHEDDCGCVWCCHIRAMLLPLPGVADPLERVRLPLNWRDVLAKHRYVPEVFGCSCYWMAPFGEGGKSGLENWLDHLAEQFAVVPGDERVRLEARLEEAKWWLKRGWNDDPATMDEDIRERMAALAGADEKVEP